MKCRTILRSVGVQNYSGRDGRNPTVARQCLHIPMCSCPEPIAKCWCHGGRIVASWRPPCSFMHSAVFSVDLSVLFGMITLSFLEFNALLTPMKFVQTLVFFLTAFPLFPSDLLFLWLPQKC